MTYCSGVLYCKSSMDKLLRRKNCKTCVNATCIEGEKCVVHVLEFPLVVPCGVVLGRSYSTVLPLAGPSTRDPRDLRGS